MNTSLRLALTSLLTITAAPSLSAIDIVVPTDAATIQAAVDAANAFDVVIVKQGVYEEAVTIDDKDDITIRSEKPGKAVVRGVEQAFVVTSSARVTIEGFDVEETTGTAVQLGAGAADCVIRNVEITNSGGIGISTQGARHLIDDCKVDGTTSSGIAITGFDSVVVDCDVSNAMVDGISVTGLQQGVINCKIDDSANNAIQLGVLDTNTNGCLVSGNKISRVGGIAILVEDADDSVVRGNSVKDAGGDGLRANQGSSGVVIAANKFVKIAGNGITIGNALAHVLDNKITKAGDRGIHMAAAQPSRVVGNTVAASANAGLAVDSNRSLFIGNRIKKSGTFDLADVGVGNIFVDNKLKTIMMDT